MSKVWTLGVRLGLGFGTVLTLMVVIIVVAISRLENLNAGTEKIVSQDWAKAELAMTVDTYARANARRTMELFIALDKESVARIKEKIDSNKKIIATSLDKLDTLIKLPEGKALMSKIRNRALPMSCRSPNCSSSWKRASATRRCGC